MLEKLNRLVGETQARLYEQTLRQLAAEDEDKTMGFRVFLWERAGAVSINWLIGIAVVIFIFAMLYPMIIDFTSQAAASTTDTSTQTMINMIPTILALVLVISILLGAFYGRER